MCKVILETSKGNININTKEELINVLSNLDSEDVVFRRGNSSVQMAEQVWKRIGKTDMFINVTYTNLIGEIATFKIKEIANAIFKNEKMFTVSLFVGEMDKILHTTLIHTITTIDNHDFLIVAIDEDYIFDKMKQMGFSLLKTRKVPESEILANIEKMKQELENFVGDRNV